MIDVPPNSTWADMDPRCRGRTFRVERVVEMAGRKVAVCTVLTNVEGAVTDRRGQRTTIAVGRFVPSNYQRIDGGMA